MQKSSSDRKKISSLSTKADEFHSLTEAQGILWRDLGDTRKALQQNLTDQNLRRQLVRDFCIYVEAHTFYLKSTCLLLRELAFQALVSDTVSLQTKTHLDEYVSVDFRASEIQLLSEKDAEVDETGAIRTTAKYIPTRRNIRFAFGAYLRSIKTGFVVNYQDNGWALLRETIELRNRLTHPKSMDDLTVSDESLNKMVIACDWFRETTVAMEKLANDKIQQFLSFVTKHEQSA